jgi:tripartite-type tricarboxylate transporter receptor subunit TctC
VFKDFAPVSLSVSAPFVLLVHPSVPAKSMKELAALARERSGKLNYATGGAGTSSHMVAELFKLVGGFDMVHVPYKGATPSLTGLLAAEVAMTFISVTAGAPHVKAERLRALGIGGSQRSPLLPEVPTIKENGYAFDAASWYGILAPKATPASTIDKVHATLTQALNTLAVRARLIEIAFEVNASSPEQFGNHLRSEHATWSKVITAAGLRSR